MSSVTQKSEFKTSSSQKSFNEVKTSLLVTLFGFMVIFSFIFILLFTFKPDLVIRRDHHGEGEHHCEPDAGKCVVGAAITSIIFMILIRVFQSFST